MPPGPSPKPSWRTPPGRRINEGCQPNRVATARSSCRGPFAISSVSKAHGTNPVPRSLRSGRRGYPLLGPNAVTQTHPPGKFSHDHQNYHDLVGRDYATHGANERCGARSWTGCAGVGHPALNTPIPKPNTEVLAVDPRGCLNGLTGQQLSLERGSGNQDAQSATGKYV